MGWLWSSVDQTCGGGGQRVKGSSPIRSTGAEAQKRQTPKGFSSIGLSLGRSESVPGEEGTANTSD